MPVKPLRINDFLQKYQKYVWYQDEISQEEHKLVGPFQFWETGRNKLIPPNMIEEKSERHWKNKEEIRESKSLC